VPVQAENSGGGESSRQVGPTHIPETQFAVALFGIFTVETKQELGKEIL